MQYPIVIHIENGRKWMVVSKWYDPEWWQRWSNTNYTYVPIDSPLLRIKEVAPHDHSLREAK